MIFGQASVLVALVLHVNISNVVEYARSMTLLTTPSDWSNYPFDPVVESFATWEVMIGIPISFTLTLIMLVAFMMYPKTVTEPMFWIDPPVYNELEETTTQDEEAGEELGETL